MSFEHLSIAEVHVYSARQAGVETPHCAHDVYALEFVRAVLLEDRRVLHGILVGPRCPINVSGIRIPRCRRIPMVVRDLAVPNDDVMRQHTAHRFIEAAPRRLLPNSSPPPPPP